MTALDSMQSSVAIRRAGDRGLADFGWLTSYHSFSFGEYHDPRHMHYHALRVINDDVVQPGRGFDTHPHADMEIVTVVVDGALEHKDSMGNGSIIRPGDVQRMTAGTGVLHSEFNPSTTEPVRLLQIWIFPERKGLEPSYEQTTFRRESREDRLALIGSRDGRDGSVTIHQDVNLYAGVVTAGASVTLRADAGRGLWVQMISGRARLGDAELQAGDGASVTSDGRVSLTGVERAELLVFDLA